MMPFDYYINDSTLTKVSSIKDLGITFDSKLNFQEHIDKMYCEASKNVFFIIRNTKTFKSTNVLELFI